MNEERGPQRAADLVDRFLTRLGRKDGAVYVSLFRGWRSIVGERIADHAEPVDVRGSALIVEADHPGWVQMVMMSRTRILRKLTRRFPELKLTALHVHVGRARAESPASAESPAPGGDRGVEAPPPSAPRPPAADEAEALGRISDDDLRGALERLRRSLE